MGKYFGTDGFRGEAGIDLTADHAYKVGRFLGWYYNALRERNGNNEPARIVIGKDTRRSSYMFEYSLVAGLTASGADAYLLHVTTTPSVAYIARVDDFDCGIMISASHIQRDSLRKVVPLQYSHVQRYLRQALQQLTILMPISQILSLRILITYIYIRIFDVPAKNHEPGPLGIQSTSKPSIHLAVPTIYSKYQE